jgi:hypothetical protein
LGAQRVEIFPITKDIVTYHTPASINWKNNVLSWQQTLSEYFSKLPENIELVAAIDGENSYRFSIQPHEK